MRNRKFGSVALPLALLAFGFTAWAGQGQTYSNAAMRDLFDDSARYSPIIDFPQRVGSAGDPASGRLNFGLAANSDAIDTTFGLFTGFSTVTGTNITSNGKVCASCHRPEFHFGLPAGPLSSFFPSNDPMFDVTPESGADPLGPSLFEDHGLVNSRVGRFNPFLDENDPFRQVFAWRKSQHVLNVVFQHGLLTDGRARELVEQARGAVFNHTQNGDERFDDVANAPNLSSQRLKDIAAFEETIIDPPELAALLDPTNPNYQTLVNDPYATVTLTTNAQKQGKKVFEKSCFGCHNEPNVFSNRDHIDNPPLVTPPSFGHVFDVGVAQRNALKLEVRRWDPVTKTRVPIVVPLVHLDGTVTNYTVKDDIGAAMTTGRYEDLHRFKVPQLRRISQLGPYFHDNSAATLEDVVDYFNSDDYNDSADGRQHPIHLNKKERADLLAFLNAL